MVVVAAIRNRNLQLPENADKLYEIADDERDPSGEKISHTEQFRSLDKAAILGEGMSAKAWRVHVHSYTSGRGQDPNKNAANNWQHNHNEHMLSTAANILSSAGLLHGPLFRLSENPHCLNPSHPFALGDMFGIADMFAMVGLMEFFYKEAPKGMRSLATSFALISLSFGYFLSSAFVSIINAITKRVTPSKQGWLHGEDLNQNNLNLFYWFLAILSLLNFGHYLFWASWYKYKPDNNDAKQEGGQPSQE